MADMYEDSLDVEEIDGLNGHPHEEPWYMRLLGLERREQHSQVLDDPDTNADDIARRRKDAEHYEALFRLATDRNERYRIYDEMDSGLVQSILDLYADETTQRDHENGKSVWIESKNEKIRRAGEECLRNCMVDDRIWAITRRMCKYGDTFERLVYQTGKGVLAWHYTPPKDVTRIEDRFSRLVGFKVQKQSFKRAGQERDISWPWDYAHFRLLGKDEESGYGSSILEPMFNPWRQVTLAEDAVLMYRLRRTPGRNLILVDVGNMEEHEAIEYVNTWRKRFRKTEFIDPSNAQYKKRFNPLSPLEDVILPTRGEDGSRVEKMESGGEPDQLFDLGHFNNKFFGAAKVPKAYLGFEGEINAKATLMQQDVRFARTGKRIQRAQIYGTRRLVEIHLTLLNDEDVPDFTEEENAFAVKMSPTSYLDEFERVELIQLRFQIVESMAGLAASLHLDPKVWAIYILVNYAKIPEDLVLKMISKRHADPQPGNIPPNVKAGMEALNVPSWMRHKITESIGTTGFFDLNEAEQKTIANLVHTSPGLRKIIGTFAEYFQDDIAYLQERQTDPSTLPPTVKGQAIEDCYSSPGDEAAKTLNEDLAKLKTDAEKASAEKPLND